MGMFDRLCTHCRVISPLGADCLCSGDKQNLVPVEVVRDHGDRSRMVAPRRKFLGQNYMFGRQLSFGKSK
jgi:hypothetical protein